MLFTVLARKAYRRNLQYRGSHLVQNLASAIFGFIYVSIWAGIGSDKPLGEYGAAGMTSYIAFNQATLWVALFLNNGLGIPESVRTGNISLDLLRPVSLFYQCAAREWGNIAYQFIYKSVPIFALYLIVFPLHVPDRITDYIGILIALLFAAHISICINYLIGLAALWTTESTWFYWVNYSFAMLLSGFFIPLEWLPAWLKTLSTLSPYPCLQYIPARFYLGRETLAALTVPAFWAAALAVLCVGATVLARRRVEVQGG